jgi:hypothetical protein
MDCTGTVPKITKDRKPQIQKAQRTATMVNAEKTKIHEEK